MKPSLTLRRRNRAPNTSHSFSENPIIDRFLHLTIDEGKSVRCLSLSHESDSCTVVFSSDDGSDSTFIANQDMGTFLASWREASDFVRKLRRVDFSPAC